MLGLILRLLIGRHDIFASVILFRSAILLTPLLSAALALTFKRAIDYDPDRCWGPCRACGMRGHKAGSCACTRRLPEAQAYVPQKTPHSCASTSSVTLNTFDREKMIRQGVHEGQNMCTPASLTRQALECRSLDPPGTP